MLVVRRLVPTGYTEARRFKVNRTTPDQARTTWDELLSSALQDFERRTLDDLLKTTTSRRHRRRRKAVGAAT